MVETIFGQDPNKKRPPQRPEQKRHPYRPTNPRRPGNSPGRPGSGIDWGKVGKVGAAVTGVGVAIGGLIGGGELLLQSIRNTPTTDPPPTATELSKPTSTPLSADFGLTYATATPLPPTLMPAPTETIAPEEIDLVSNPEQTVNETTDLGLIDIEVQNQTTNNLYDQIYQHDGPNVLYPFSVAPDKVTFVSNSTDIPSICAMDGRYNSKSLSELAGSQFGVTTFTFNNTTPDNPVVLENPKPGFNMDTVHYDPTTDTLYVEMGTQNINDDTNTTYNGEVMIYMIRNAHKTDVNFLGEIGKLTSNGTKLTQGGVLPTMDPHGKPWEVQGVRKNHEINPDQPPVTSELVAVSSPEAISIEAIGFYPKKDSVHSYKPLGPGEFPFLLAQGKNKKTELLFVQQTLPEKYKN